MFVRGINRNLNQNIFIFVSYQQLLQKNRFHSLVAVADSGEKPRGAWASPYF